jgi:hypothetical protein
MNGRRALAALFMVGLLVGCSPAGKPPTTTTAADSQTAEMVAITVLDALAAADPGVAASHTLTDQMAWLAMAEGASIEEAAALLDSGADQVAVNYWTGFMEAGSLPAVVVDAVDETEVGSHSFALVRAGELRLVLREGLSWKVDVVASFGAALAERLVEAAGLVASNRGDEADRLRLLLLDQRDSVEVASTDPSLTGPAQQGLAALAEALAGMAS